MSLKGGSQSLHVTVILGRIVEGNEPSENFLKVHIEGRQRDFHAFQFWCSRLTSRAIKPRTPLKKAENGKLKFGNMDPRRQACLR